MCMRGTLRLLVGFLILSFAAGSTSAALACVEAPLAAMSTTTPAGCPEMPVKPGKHGHATACVQMCAAMAPAPTMTAAPPPLIACTFALRSHPLLAWNAGPEPPPPRAG
jgi:hypothetical protein